ncbi:Scr1 family TA system antitoxin-like transcriptional regulator [Streptomyces sp. NPDC005283]|uniref:Scr1 family TA system antitoxin-like transcriptional regulator n=1 Tax=Streptomyces sp. NPDC005283 TaxID=3156871 RepID=UPI003455774B
MTASPSSSAQAAREALAVRLQHLRKDAGLTGKELSARCGWHPAKTTRIQKGEAAPSDADIRTWCAACGADDQAEDLIATARAVDSMYLEWRRLHRNGMRKVQEGWYALHEQTRVCRVYVSNVPPGFFQTPGFATALMSQITTFQGTPNDVSEAVAARVARSRFLYEGGHRPPPSCGPPRARPLRTPEPPGDCFRHPGRLTYRHAGESACRLSVDVLHGVLFAGRAHRIHVLFGGQLDNTPWARWRASSFPRWSWDGSLPVPGAVHRADPGRAGADGP